MDTVERTAWKVADALDRFERRLDEYYSSDRKHQRKRYRQTLTARVPNTPDAAADSDWTERRIWSRDVTPSGISFLSTDKILSNFIVVCLIAADGKATQLRANILRSRKVHDGFWEFGAEFVARVDGQQAAEQRTDESPQPAADSAEAATVADEAVASESAV